MTITSESAPSATTFIHVPDLYLMVTTGHLVHQVVRCVGFRGDATVVHVLQAAVGSHSSARNQLAI